MLSKLLKHEFRATARFMWVIYAAMLALSVGANVSFRVMDMDHSARILRAIAVLLMVAWVLALVIGGVMIIVLLIQRFYKNLLTDEGYLMFTLPTTVHHLVLSKLIVAVVWFLVTILAYILCVSVAVFENAMLRDIVDFIRQMFQHMTVHYALNGTAIVLEVLLLLAVSTAASCLQFYSAMSIGYGFTNHKGLWSVVFYFIINFALQLIATIVTVVLGTVDMPVNLLPNLTAMQAWHLTMLSVTAGMLVISAVFYIITVLNLQKRLNLA